MIRKNYSRFILSGLSIMLFTSNAFAFKPFKSREQQTHPGHSVTTPAAPTSAPFDGGITLLIAAGIGYASKKGYDKRKQLKGAQQLEK
jgi:hypothetical protein